MWTLKEVECLGACANAPMIQINDDFYVRSQRCDTQPLLTPSLVPQECLTPETTIQVLESFKAGSPIRMTKWGSKPMNGQISCEGPMVSAPLPSSVVES